MTKAVAKQTDKKPGWRTAYIKPIQFNDPQPQLPTLDTAKFADFVHATFLNWARWDNDHDPIILTLWTISTYFREAGPDGSLKGPLLTDAHPRIGLVAPPGSGKTRNMKIVRALANHPTGIVKPPVTAPGIRNALDDGMTVLLDELNRVFNTGRANIAVQSLVSAYERDTVTLDGRGGLNQMEAFGPLMWAAKPEILTTTHSDALADLFERAFLLTPVKHTDPDDPIPPLDSVFKDFTEDIPKALTMWGEAARWDAKQADESIITPIHSVPRKLVGRMRELADPLLAVADRAVNPQKIAEEGQDIRWAQLGRTAVQASLLGYGSNGGDIAAKLTSKMEALGITLPE